MEEFSYWKARAKLPDSLAYIPSFTNPVVLLPSGLTAQLSSGKNGLNLSKHKNTWKRKRETGFLIRVEYFHNGNTLLYHVEPWVNYPSDVLIAKLMLLPVGVNNAALAT